MLSHGHSEASIPWTDDAIRRLHRLCEVFDRIPDILKLVTWAIGISRQLSNLIRAIYTDHSYTVKAGSSPSGLSQILKGVPQGSVFIPLWPLFA